MTDIVTGADPTARPLAEEESPDVFRPLSIASVAIVSIGLSLSPSNCAADAVNAATTEPLKVILLPARAHVARAGFVNYEEVEEWTETARANLNNAIADRISRSPAFSLVPLPVLSAEELGELEEFIAVANLATTQFGGFSLFGEVKVQRTAADRALGPSLAFLNERTATSVRIFTGSLSEGMVLSILVLHILQEKPRHAGDSNR